MNATRQIITIIAVAALMPATIAAVSVRSAAKKCRITERTTLITLRVFLVAFLAACCVRWANC